MRRRLHQFQFEDVRLLSNEPPPEVVRPAVSQTEDEVTEVVPGPVLEDRGVGLVAGLGKEVDVGLQALAFSVRHNCLVPPRSGHLLVLALF